MFVVFQILRQKYYKTSATEYDAVFEWHILSQEIVKVGILIQRRANMKKEIENTNDTSVSQLDELISTCMQSGLTIIGGRPGTGKTSLLLDIVSRALLKNQPTPTLIFSLEMTKEQTVSRLLKVKEDAYQEDNLEFLHIEDSFLPCNDIRQPSILDISSKIKTLNDSFDEKLGLIAIDYLQLIGSVNKNNPRKDEESEILKTLKALAKDLNIPIISSAHVYRYDGTKPNIDDFRIDNIEQHTDSIVLLNVVGRDYKLKKRIVEAEALRNNKVETFNLIFNCTKITFENIE